MKYVFLIIFTINNSFYLNAFTKNLFQEYFKQDTIIINASMKPFIFISECDTINYSNFGYDYKNYIVNVKVIDLEKGFLIQTISDTGDYWEPSFKFLDVNLDGFLDMEFYIGHSNLVPIYSFWLYDSTESLFIHSKEYSSLNDYSIDTEKRVIESYAQFMGGQGGSMEKYKILNGHLSLIETEYSSRNNFEHKEIINGVLRTTQLTEEDWLEDDQGNSIIVIYCYSFIHDSLLLTEINWLTYVNKNISEDMYSSDIYNCGPWGECLKYLRQEVYSYDTNYKVIETKKYLVINDQWEEVNSFK